MAEDQDLIALYTARGLTEPFANAIISGKLQPEEVMKFWAMDWHKQYPDSEDLLVQAVLDGTLKPEEGEWLNSVRSNHEQLIQACIAGACTIDWAKSLLEAGFMHQPDLVTDILNGAEPLVIAQLGGIETDAKLFPPKLEQKWIPSLLEPRTRSVIPRILVVQEKKDFKVKKSPKISSPAQFMSVRPKNFTVDIGYGIVEYNLALTSSKCLTYIATIKKDGILSEVDKVEIYFDKNDARHIAKQFNIILADPVIIYSAAFFSKSLRKAHIAPWSGDALIKYCGFRFF